MPDTPVSPYMPLVPFKLLPLCWSSEGVSLSKSVRGFFKGNCLKIQQFLLLTQCPLVFAARSYGDLYPGIGILVWGSLCVEGAPCFHDIPPEFLSTICRCGTSVFHVSAPPTSLDGCGFFNSVVVRLPFNSISDGSE